MPMHLDAFLWLFLPLFVAGGSALLSFYIMQARMEVSLAKERESLAEARAIINSHKTTLEERIKAAEEATRRATMDELLQDFRIEERSYVRESKALARRTMVMQERMFFRNIPLSTWMEHEMIVEDGNAAPEQLPQAARTAMAPTAAALEPGEGRLPISKMLDEVAETGAAQDDGPREELQLARQPARQRENRTLVPAHAAFGAQ